MIARVGPPHFESEAALCAAFIVWVAAEQKGWTCYAETAGWDILVVHADGTQVGVQAKLRLNIDVIEQVVESIWAQRDGPDFRAVLVPGDCRPRPHLMNALGVTTIKSERRIRGDGFEFSPAFEGRYSYGTQWHYANPERRHELPSIVPDVPAGVPSPAQLTEWKIAALRLVAILDIRGYVTRSDFSHCGIDHRRWVPAGWLVAGDAGRYLRGPDLMFEKQHPVVFAQIRAETEKAMPV